MGKLIDKEDEVIEIVLDETELDGLINKLKYLKESKAHIHFDINNNHLLIHHENDELLK